MLVTFRKCIFEQNLLVSFSKFNTIYSKKISTSESKFRQTPKCVYVLPPSQWLKNKINFQRLKLYDTDFSEKEFVVGATQAALVMLEIARLRDSAHLAKVSTLRGFSRIYRDMFLSQNDPRRKLLYFVDQDIKKVVPTDVQIAESEGNVLCLVEVFFVCLKYLDDIMKLYEVSNPNASLQIYQDIKEVEKMLKKKNFSDRIRIPLSEKLLVTEGYLHLFASYPQEEKNEKESEWKIDLFKISDFNIVHYKSS